MLWFCITLFPSLMFIQVEGTKIDVSSIPYPQKLTETSSWRGRNDNCWEEDEEEEDEDCGGKDGGWDEGLPNPGPSSIISQINNMK